MKSSGSKTTAEVPSFRRAAVREAHRIDPADRFEGDPPAQGVDHAPVGRERQALGRDRWAGEVATQAFDRISVVGLDLLGKHLVLVGAPPSRADHDQDDPCCDGSAGTDLTHGGQARTLIRHLRPPRRSSARHALPGGVYSSASPLERPVFHRAEPLTDQAVVELATRTHRRILRHLPRCGRLPRAEHDEEEPDEPLLAELYAASVQGRSVLAERKGSGLERLGRRRDARPLSLPGELCASLDGPSPGHRSRASASRWPRTDAWSTN